MVGSLRGKFVQHRDLDPADSGERLGVGEMREFAGTRWDEGPRHGVVRRWEGEDGGEGGGGGG